MVAFAHNNNQNEGLTMQRDERALLEKLTAATQSYIDKHKKFSEESMKQQSLFQRTLNFFSVHGPKGYNRASALQTQLASFSDDNAALKYIYNQAFNISANLYKSNELKGILLDICAKHINAKDTSEKAIGYAIVRRITNATDDEISKYIRSKVKYSPFLDLGINATPHSVISDQACQSAALTQYINELFGRDIENNSSPDVRM